MTRMPALAPYTILCSRYVESVSTPSNEGKFLVGPRMSRLLYTGDRKPRVVAGVEKPGGRNGDVLPPHTPAPLYSISRCHLLNVGDGSFNSYVYTCFVISLFYEIKQFLKKLIQTGKG
jgi:hypothetical protein